MENIKEEIQRDVVAKLQAIVELSKNGADASEIKEKKDALGAFLSDPVYFANTLNLAGTAIGEEEALVLVDISAENITNYDFFNTNVEISSEAVHELASNPLVECIVLEKPSAFIDCTREVSRRNNQPE